jgi:hypothetical protein
MRRNGGADSDPDGCVENACCVDFSFKIRSVLGRWREGAGQFRPMGYRHRGKFSTRSQAAFGLISSGGMFLRKKLP